MPPIKDQSGAIRLRNWVKGIADEEDRVNALSGVGLQIFIATVIKPTPNIEVIVNGIVNLTNEPFILSEAEGDLYIPEDLRLTQGDKVTMIPFPGGNQFWILGKIREGVPITESRYGYNGDHNNNDPTNEFVGMKVTVSSGDSGTSSTILIRGNRVDINSFGATQVFINGINFGTHTHSNPEGGSTGGPV